jgi:hypothetical protein
MVFSKAEAPRRASWIALAAIGFPAFASAQSLEGCARLMTDSARLACYDQVVGRQEDGSTPPAAAVTQAPEAAVGLPALYEARVESRIAGHFEGWEKGTRLTLENGQVWQTTDDSSVYFVAESPKVTIEPGSFGSFFLNVDGLRARATVKRLR